ncbi:MAG: DegT/DnrJ/EryC1/StrS family aminotransferase [Clostridia bacterium]|nr:DegT/DnrJ/EryC1/StrS family aminotransferase [Clostridia bacterium]
MNIPLLDLKAQYNSIRNEIQEAVSGVLESGHYVLGPNVKALEEEIAAYCGVKYGVGVANGTDALMLSLLTHGIGPGDEVITTPYTFFATAEVVSQLGATPVFVDIDARTYNLDVNQIEARITKRTKAIIPVHIFGQMADMDAVMAIARKHNLAVIEDACQAIGARYKGRMAGSIGNTGCFSFFPTKNLGGYGDGGMVVTNDEVVAEKIRVLRVHGSKPKYYHSMVGYNSRLDELQAAILRVKFRYIDEWNKRRAERADEYDRLFAGSEVGIPYAEQVNKHIYHLYIISSLKRDQIKAALAQEGIASAVYYPVPLHRQEVYQSLGYEEGSLPVAEKVARETLAIPLYPELTKKQQERIADIVLSAIS